MTVGAILARTTNYFFRKLNFDYPFWHSHEHDNWDELDTILESIAGERGIDGPWTNSLVVAVGDKRVDTVSGDVYTALVAHTTPSSGTFSDSRTANPSYWVLNTVADNSITVAKLQQIATSSLLGRLTTGTGNVEVLTKAQATAALNLNAHGQCQLVKDGTNLKLNQKNGGKLVINGAVCSVPNAGVTLAQSTLTINTTYYIYARDSNGDGEVDTLEASTTAPTTHTDGVTIKTGDATRTLVGICRATAGPAVLDTDAARNIRSYFNRVPGRLKGAFTAVRTTASGPFVIVNSESNVTFVCFDDDVVTLSSQSYTFNSSATNNTFSAPGVDAAPTGTEYALTYGSDGGYAAYTNHFRPSTGFHTGSIYGAVDGGTGSFGSITHYGTLVGSVG